MRKKRLLYNTYSSLAFQVTSVVCGFILPRLILGFYGSEVNGLVNSIANFISFISFFEFGIGAVIQSALYKPLADNDYDQVSRVVASAQKFFSLLARILFAYIVILVVVYPTIVRDDFGFVYTALLIVAMSVNSFAQYFFGIINNIILGADQRGYIQYSLQILELILNTIACYIIIRLGYGIQVVKITTSLIYLIRPILMKIYVDKHYNINRKITYDVEPITQKWNGVAQHLSSIVLDNTDVLVLTFFSSLSNVSIYSVYHAVVYGIKRLFTIITNGIQSLLGELLAKNEIEKLKKVFSLTEWVVHTSVVFAFGCVFVLICPFVSVYTNGVTDTNYIVPAFAALITLANAFHALRLPYISMIFAGGHYKETQGSFIIAAVLNLAISVITVYRWGLIGVAIGTLIAMAYQTTWMAWYTSKNFTDIDFKYFVKQLIVDILVWVAGYFSTRWINLADKTYLAWVIMAIEVSLIWMINA